MACGDPVHFQELPLLDPELTLSQPNSVCMATAMDAWLTLWSLQSVTNATHLPITMLCMVFFVG